MTYVGDNAGWKKPWVLLMQVEGDSDVQKSVAAKAVSLWVIEGHMEKFWEGVPSPTNKPDWKSSESWTALLWMST
jgi:hypothetical protein